MKRDDQFAKNNFSVTKSSSCIQASVACGSFQFLKLSRTQNISRNQGLKSFEEFFIIYVSGGFLYKGRFWYKRVIYRLVYRDYCIYIWILASHFNICHLLSTYDLIISTNSSFIPMIPLLSRTQCFAGL